VKAARIIRSIERWVLRPRHWYSAGGGDNMLKPLLARNRGRVLRIYFYADADFAHPEVYEFLEAEACETETWNPPAGSRSRLFPPHAAFCLGRTSAESSSISAREIAPGKALPKSRPAGSLTVPHDAVISSHWRLRQNPFRHKLRRRPRIARGSGRLASIFVPRDDGRMRCTSSR
jgi:hypothetical protein